MLGKVLSEISTNESLFVCGDMNGHVGKGEDGYHGANGGNGFGSRNMEGGLLLKFVCAMDLVIANKGRCKRWVRGEYGGIQSGLESVVGFQCTNCCQGLVAESRSNKLCPSC